MWLLTLSIKLASDAIKPRQERRESSWWAFARSGSLVSVSVWMVSSWWPLDRTLRTGSRATTGKLVSLFSAAWQAIQTCTWWHLSLQALPCVVTRRSKCGSTRASDPRAPLKRRDQDGCVELRPSGRCGSSASPLFTIRAQHVACRSSAVIPMAIFWCLPNLRTRIKWNGSWATKAHATGWRTRALVSRASLTLLLTTFATRTAATKACSSGKYTQIR